MGTENTGGDTITSRALKAAEEVQFSDGPGGGAGWQAFEADATRILTDILSADPGPAMRLEPNSYELRARGGHQYPGIIQSKRILVFYPEGHEVVAVRSSKNGADFYVVRRSDNPMEEAMLAPFDNLGDFGRAIA